MNKLGHDKQDERRGPRWWKLHLVVPALFLGLLPGEYLIHSPLLIRLFDFFIALLAMGWIKIWLDSNSKELSRYYDKCEENAELAGERTRGENPRDLPIHPDSRDEKKDSVEDHGILIHGIKDYTSCKS